MSMYLNMKLDVMAYYGISSIFLFQTLQDTVYILAVDRTASAVRPPHEVGS